VEELQMETLHITANPGKRGRITFDVPQNLRSRKLDMVVVINESPSAIGNKNVKKYDFSGLAGRLQWKGNAVKEQRRLRNEW
jgi:hypothetical protein